MSIQTLIEEMQAVKADNEILSISEVLTIFQIEALNNLTKTIRNQNG
jgi:hypothetical protein